MMNNKYGYFKYSDIAFGAKEDIFGFGTFGNVQTGSDITQLSMGVDPYDFASFEQGEYITDNPKRLYKGKEKLGYLSSFISDESGYIYNSGLGANLSFSFRSYYSASGITIHSRNIIDEIEIIAYRDDEEITSGTFSATQNQQFYSIPIELANRIEIIIRKIAEPKHFVGIYSIDYGTIRIFDESVYQNVNINQHFSVLGNTLEYDTLDLSIVDFDNKDYLFQVKQPIEYIADNNVKARFYINEGKEKNEIVTDLSCYDVISNLEDDFLGGIYNNYSAKQLIDDILDGKQINYEIDESINNVLLNGYLPITSRRKALQSVLFGSNIRCYKGDKLYFKPFNATLEALVLDEKNIIDKPQKTKKQEIKSVVLKKHNYSKGTESVEVYHWYISKTENVTIRFSQPVHSLEAYEVIGVDENGYDIIDTQQTSEVVFIEKEPNYCIVSNISSNKIVIKGLNYIDSTTDYEKKRNILSVTGYYDDVNFETTISNDPQAVCDLLYDLYSRKNSINFVTFENLKIGGYYNILGENLNIKSIKQSLNGLYEVEAV